MLELNAEVMVGDGKHSQPLITYGRISFDAFLLAQYLWQAGLQKFILQQDDREHDVLECILVPIQLTEHCAQIQVGVG